MRCSMSATREDRQQHDLFILACARWESERLKTKIKKRQKGCQQGVARDGKYAAPPPSSAQERKPSNHPFPSATYPRSTNPRSSSWKHADACVAVLTSQARLPACDVLPADVPKPAVSCTAAPPPPRLRCVALPAPPPPRTGAPTRHAPAPPTPAPRRVRPTPPALQRALHRSIARYVASPQSLSSP
jgi:hypothetical protein